MPAIGVITFEISIPEAHSLKDKRQVVKSLKDRLRARHNVAVAEIDFQDVWQHALVSAVTVSPDRTFAEKVLHKVEADAANQLGGMLTGSHIEWI